MEKDRLINIIEDLKEVRTLTKSKVSDEILFQQGVDIYISEIINESKEKIKTSLATSSQINLLKKLKIQFNPKITKKEAQDLISNNLK